MSVASVIRMSPNEEVAALQRRSNERRVARILQVREQDRGLANKVRTKVRVTKEAEKTVLDVRLQENLAHFQQMELLELETQLRSKVGELGEAHRAALECMRDEYKLQNADSVVKSERESRAQSRHKIAMKALSDSKRRESEDLSRHTEWKRMVRDTENRRAKGVISRKSSSPPPVIMDLVVSKGHRVQFKDADGYATSYYHIPHTIVQRDQPVADSSAKQVAMKKTQEDAIKSKKTEALKQEQHEKARMRFKYALAKLRLEKDKVEMMSELETLTRSDRARRQKALAIMPEILYQPTDKRLEMGSEQQREMEHAFEKLFVRKQNYFQRKPVRKRPPFVLPNSTSWDSSDHSSDSDSLDGHLPQKPGFASPQNSPPGGKPPTPSPSHPADSMGKKHVAFKPYAALSSSSTSMEDVSPVSAQPIPVTPPKHPLNAWSSSDAMTMTTTPSPSLDNTPISPHWRDNPKTKGPEESPLVVTSPSKSTQTHIPTFQSIKGVTQGLSQPDLSVTDSAISSKKGDTRAARVSAFKPPRPASASRHIKRTMDPSLPPHGRDASSKKKPLPHKGSPPRRSSPKACLPTESMEKLKSLVKAQQDAWEERENALEGVQATDKSEEKQEEEGLLSFSTLSTRDSTPALVDRATSKYPPLSRSITNSPAPLSISQCHTTLEASALSMGEPDRQNQPQSPSSHQDREGKRSWHATLPRSPVAHRKEQSSKPFRKANSPRKRKSPKQDDHFRHRRSGSQDQALKKSQRRCVKGRLQSPSPPPFQRSSSSQDRYRKYRSQSPSPYPLPGQGRACRQSSPLDPQDRPHNSSHSPSPWPSPVGKLYHSRSPSTQPSDYRSRSPSAQPTADKKINYQVSVNTTLEPSMSVPDLPTFADCDELMVDAQPKCTIPSQDFHRAKVDYRGLDADLSMSPGTAVDFAPGGKLHAVQHRFVDSKAIPTITTVGRAVIDPSVRNSKVMDQNKHAPIAEKIRKGEKAVKKAVKKPAVDKFKEYSTAAVPMQQTQASRSHPPKGRGGRPPHKKKQVTPFVQSRVEYKTKTKDISMSTVTSTGSCSSGELEEALSSSDPSCSASELPFQAPAKTSRVEQPAALKQMLQSALDGAYEDLAHPSLDVTSSSIPVVDLETEEQASPLRRDQNQHAPSQPTSLAPSHPLFFASRSQPAGLHEEVVAQKSSSSELCPPGTYVTNFHPLAELGPTSPLTSTNVPPKPLASIVRVHPVLHHSNSQNCSQPSTSKSNGSQSLLSSVRSTATTSAVGVVSSSSQLSPKLRAKAGISPSAASMSLTAISSSPAVSSQLSPPKLQAPPTSRTGLSSVVSFPPAVASFSLSPTTSVGTKSCDSDPAPPAQAEVQIGTHGGTCFPQALTEPNEAQNGSPTHLSSLLQSSNYQHQQSPRLLSLPYGQSDFSTSQISATYHSHSAQLQDSQPPYIGASQYSSYHPGSHRPYLQEGEYQEPPQPPQQQQASYYPVGLQLQGSQAPTQQQAPYHSGSQHLPTHQQEMPHLLDTYQAQSLPQVRPPHHEQPAWMGNQQTLLEPVHTQGSPKQMQAAWSPQVHGADHQELQYIQASRNFQTAPAFHHHESQNIQDGSYQHGSHSHYEGSPQMQAFLQPHPQYISPPLQTSHVQGVQPHPHLSSSQMQAAQIHPGFRHDSSGTQSSHIQGLQPFPHHEPSQIQASNTPGLQPFPHHESLQMQASNAPGLQPFPHHESLQIQAPGLQPYPHHESDYNKQHPPHELSQMQQSLASQPAKHSELPPPANVESPLQKHYQSRPEDLWTVPETQSHHSQLKPASPQQSPQLASSAQPTLQQDSQSSSSKLLAYSSSRLPSRRSPSVSVSSGHSQSSDSASPKQSPQLASSTIANIQHSSTRVVLSPSPPTRPMYELYSCDQSSVSSDDVVHAHSPTQGHSDDQSSECSYGVAPSNSAHTYTRHPSSNSLGTLQSLPQVRVQPVLERWGVPGAQATAETSSSTQFSMEQWDIPSNKPLMEQWNIPSVGSSESALSPGVKRHSSFSLQDAFQKKKEEFIKNSKDRLSNLKANALKRQQAIMVQGNYSKGALKPTIHTVGPSGSKNGSKKNKRSREDLVVRHSNSPARLFATHTKEPKKLLPAPVLSSSKREKIKKAEMRERNLKFYSQLPEVKLKKMEEKRVRDYEENRKKAKVYQQRILNKMKKTLQSQSKTPVKQKTASRPPLPPPFK